MLSPCAKLSAAPSRRFGRHLLGIDAAMVLVGRQHHDEVGLAGGLGCRHDVKAVGSRPLAAAGAGRQRDGDGDAAVAQVERLGAPLIAVAEDRHPLRADQRQIGIGIEIDAHRTPSAAEQG